MRVGMIGLGRMGGSLARRLMRAGHETIVWDRDAAAVASLVTDGAAPATSLAELAGQLGSDAIFWVMLPAGDPTETTIDELSGLAGPATSSSMAATASTRTISAGRSRWRSSASTMSMSALRAESGAWSAAFA